MTVGTPDDVTTRTTAENTVTVSIRAADGGIAEDDGQVGQDDVEVFTVALTGGTPSEDVVVRYSVSGDVSSEDYTSMPELLTIAVSDDPPETKLTINVADDGFEEGDETLTITLELVDQPAGVSLGIRSATATIEASDPLNASVTTSQGKVEEGDDVRFTVSLDGTSTEDVLVSYKVSGEVDTDDYNGPSSGTLTMLAGNSSGTLLIPTENDDDPEPDEDLTVSLVRATTGGRNVTVSNDTSTDTSTVTIGADDGNVLVAVAAQSQTVSEGEPARFVVSLSGTVSTAVTVAYATEDGVATEGDNDYTAAAATVTILAGKTSVTIAVATGDDDDAEENETFSVTLPEARNANLPAGVAIGTERATTTIRDDDPLTVSVTGPESVNAGSSPSGYRVELSGGLGSAEITVEYSAGGTTGSVDITAGQSGANIITVPSIAQDATGTFVVTLTRVTPIAGRGGVGIAAGEAEHESSPLVR